MKNDKLLLCHCGLLNKYVPMHLVDKIQNFKVLSWQSIIFVNFDK